MHEETAVRSLPRQRALCGLLLLLLGAAGCASSLKIFQYRQPKVVSRVENKSFVKMRTFGIVPYSAIWQIEAGRGDTLPQIAVNEDEERLLLTELAERLQHCAYYRLVTNPDSAEFVITMTSTGDYHPDTNLARRAASPPLATLKLFDPHAYLSTREHTGLPRQSEVKTGSRFSLPLVRVFGYDPQTREPLVTINAGSVEETRDFMLAAQRCLFAASSRIQANGDVWWTSHNDSGMVGLNFHTAIIDGKDIWPVIDGVVEGAAAARDGMTPGSIIISINGVPMRNRSFIEVLDAFRGRPGDIRKLVTSRSGKLYSHDIVMTRRSPEN